MDHLGQNEIRRTVQNTRDFNNVVGCQALADRADDRDAAAHTGLKEEVHVLFLRYLQKLRALRCHQLLVGCHNALAGFHAAHRIFKRRMQAAHHFHYNADLRIVYDVVKRFGEFIRKRAVRKFP